MNRREFIKTSAATGAAVAGTTFFIGRAEAVNDEIHPDPNYANPKVETIRTACMMCNAGCGLQVRVKDGVAIKIEGNPYCAHTNDYGSAGATVAASDVPDSTTNPGRICARGNGGLMTVYNPYRLTTPLRRVGPRGSGRWESISWLELANDLVNGGQIPNAFGTGSYAFEGMLAIRGTAAPYAAASGNIDANDTAFSAEAKAGDPANFGKKANRYVWIRGRDQISQVTKRFNDSFGTVNHIEHSTLCNTSWATAMKHNFFSWAAGNYQYFRAELTNVNYLILLGTNPLEANVGTPYWARKLTDMKAAGGKLVVVDPHFTPTASKADQWIPITPGTDLALVSGMVRHLIDAALVDEEYLKVTHSGIMGSYKNWTAASYLVWGELNGAEFTAEGYLTDKDAGLTSLTTLYEAITDKGATTIKVVDAAALPAKGVVMIDKEITYYDGKTQQTGYWDLTGCKRGIDTSAATHAIAAEVLVPYVVMDGGTVKRYFEPASTAAIDLKYKGQVNGHEVMTSYELLVDEVGSRTAAEWAQLCSVPEATIKQLVVDFMAPGNKSCLEAYRGATQHTNGLSAAVMVHIFNTLAGRIDRTGGCCQGKRFGVKEEAKAGNRAVPSGLTSGVRIDRAGAKYEGTAPTPTRMWYPVASLVSQETLLSAAQGYPYKCKALALYCFNPAYTTPNNQPQAAALNKHDQAGEYAVPLVFSNSLFMDETAALSDYVIPDSSYLERFSWPFTSYPTVKTKSATIRRPVIGKYKEITIEGRPARIYVPHNSVLDGVNFATVDDLLAAWSGPMPYDEFLIQLAKKLQLPNFGLDVNATGAAGAHIDTAWELWDFVAKKGDFASGLDNEGKDGTPGSFDTSGGYMELGGKWENPAEIEDPAAAGWAKNRYGSCIYLFREKPVHYTNPFTGEHYHGMPHWEAPGRGLKGNFTDYAAAPGHNLYFNTAKRAWQVQSRSTNNDWLFEIEPDNFLYLNPVDAGAMSLVTGDLVKVSSVTNPAGVFTRVNVTERVMPGTSFMYHHMGRKWFGSEPVYVNGSALAFDKRFASGSAANPVVEGDPDFPDLPFTEQLSGAACYYNGKIKIEKA